ncbi:Rv1733c family protein [Streptacidiphilus jiangxiensis]|uniref:Uncharacterized protein n=1 Tax=Streptacidiphilus jiangxiensis TaxID=235985 RepID=A0A1H7WQF7_STRJI|nr:hypothetical protein [Streptacidiphilus jiangxiensis]SEM23722.1 hypothetical protein SAMN05414137_12158 [Streptacidiphilus jiangxiensis]
MLGVFAAVAALCGALAPWSGLPLVVAVCWGCYDGFVVRHDGAPGWQAGPDLRTLALFGAIALLARLLAGPVERAAGRRAAVARAAVEANPLFRADDRRRARLRRSRVRLMAVSVGLGLAVALAVQARDAAEAAVARRQGHPVTATTLADAVPPPATRLAARGGGATVQSVPAAWEYPAGVRHTGRVVVFRRQAAGTRVTVWVDDAGRPAVVPASAPDRVASAVLVGVSASAVLALLCALASWAAGHRLDRRASRAWAEDWARVEPYWSGRRRNEDAPGGR